SQKEGADTLVVLVHGLGGSAGNWLEVMGELARVGPVVAPDLPGFGRTEPPRPGASRIGANLAFLRALLRHLDLGRVTVQGNSMGGMLSVLLAAAEQAAVERLVLVDPALPGPRVRLGQLDRDTLRTFAPFSVPRLGHRVLGRRYAESTAEELFDETQQLAFADPSRVRPPMRRLGLENTAYGMRTPWRLDGMAAAGQSLVANLLHGGRLKRALDAVAAPTLVVWGDQDRLVGWPVIEATLARRPDFELAVLDDVGHAPMIEAPDRFVATVLDFYARTGLGEPREIPLRSRHA
ncbi:MAG: alpha/beta fold hydrolase, partial [Nitriliruptoraceae bacterium]